MEQYELWSHVPSSCASQLRAYSIHSQPSKFHVKYILQIIIHELNWISVQRSMKQHGTSCNMTLQRDGTHTKKEACQTRVPITNGKKKM